MKDKFYEIQKLGLLLQQKRKSLGYDLKQVAESTRIRHEYLEALEQGDYAALPVDVYTQGFILNYSKYLGLKPQITLALFRREKKSLADQKYNLQAEKKPLREKFSFQLSQEKLVIVAVAIGVVIFLVYLISRINTVIRPPAFEVTSPVNISGGSEQIFRTSQDKFSIKGKLELGSTLKINDSEFDTKNLDVFEIPDLTLHDGENVYALKATSQFGVMNQIVLKVMKDPSSASGTPDQTTQPSTLPQSMLVEIIIGPRDANLAVTIDGKEVQNWVETTGTTKTYHANNSVKVQTPRPDSVRIAINGAEKQLGSATSKEWVLIEGKVYEK